MFLESTWYGLDQRVHRLERGLDQKVPCRWDWVSRFPIEYITWRGVEQVHLLQRGVGSAG